MRQRLGIVGEIPHLPELTARAVPPGNFNSDLRWRDLETPDSIRK